MDFRSVRDSLCMQLSDQAGKDVNFLWDCDLVRAPGVTECYLSYISLIHAIIIVVEVLPTAL